MPKLPKNADIDVSIVMKDGVFIGGTFDNDPHVNPKAWDDKVWELVLTISSGEGKRDCYHTSDSVVAWAMRVTAEVYGERPQEEEEE